MKKIICALAFGMFSLSAHAVGTYWCHYTCADGYSAITGLKNTWDEAYGAVDCSDPDRGGIKPGTSIECSDASPPLNN